MKILANDGMDASGIEILSKNGFEVFTESVPQDKLADFINQNNIEILVVRSATKVREELIKACPSLKIIGRGGVGLDNIDVAFAESRGIKVIYTPAASSLSVAELVFAHLFSGVRFLADANRKMPVSGAENFAKLKKSYAAGTELRGKTLGIIGMGRIGQEVAKMALGLGMRVIASDSTVGKSIVKVDFYNGQTIDVEILTEPMAEILQHADFVTLHVPAQKSGYLIGEKEFDLMKPGAAIINCARGGVIDEKALLNALNSGKIKFAGLDVFENEPTPSKEILSHERISLTPHIGAATAEAQDRIGVSLAEQILEIYGK